MPEVSAVMVIDDDVPLLQESIDSMLSQSLTDIELIIVVDGMGNRFDAEIPHNTCSPKVRVIRNEHHLGTARSLNRGHAFARGEYVARADMGDMSFPRRLEIQARFLNSHPDVAAVGTAARRAVADRGDAIIERYPNAPALVTWSMHFGMAMYPGSMLYRRSAFEQVGGYSTTAAALDYDMSCRIMRYHSLASLPEVLLECRSPTRTMGSEVMVDDIRHTIEVTLGRPVDRGFVRALLHPSTIEDRRNAIGAAWLLNSIVRSYRTWYRDRTREEGMMVKDDAAARMSHVMTYGLLKAPMSSPMIAWHAARAGPGITYRIITALLRQGVGRLQQSPASDAQGKSRSTLMTRM